MKNNLLRIMAVLLALTLMFGATTNSWAKSKGGEGSKRDQKRDGRKA